jgi:hypothetical protein
LGLSFSRSDLMRGYIYAGHDLATLVFGEFFAEFQLTVIMLQSLSVCVQERQELSLSVITEC